VHVFEATGLSGTGPQRLDADEDLTVERCPIGEAAGRLTDACSLAALQLRG
jgi:hypothetical protein